MRKTCIMWSFGLVFLTAGLLACGGGGGNGGSFEISGTITLASTGQPIVQAMLTLFGSGSGVIFTDDNGFYRFSGLQDGVYNILPSDTGYTFLPTELILTISGQSLTGQNILAYATAPAALTAAEAVSTDGGRPGDLQTAGGVDPGFPVPPVATSGE